MKTFASQMHHTGETNDHGKWQQESPRQHNVFVAALLTDSVSPLPQGLVAPVVVAAGAAEVSHSLDSPKRHLARLSDEVADRHCVSPHTSSSAAAASSSHTEAHT